MKKSSFFLIVLLLLMNGTLVAAAPQVFCNLAYVGNWQMNPAHALGMEVGGWDPAAYGKVEYNYWKLDNEPLMHFLVSGEISPEKVVVTSGYGYPDIKPFELEIALSAERVFRTRTTQVDIALTGRRETMMGNLDVRGHFGTAGGSLGLLYSGEKRLVDRLTVLGSAGIDYSISLEESQEKEDWAIPVSLGAAYALTGCTALKAQLSSDLTDPENTLALAVAVQTSFNFAGKKESGTVNVPVVVNGEVLEEVAFDSLYLTEVNATSEAQPLGSACVVEHDQQGQSPVPVALTPSNTPNMANEGNGSNVSCESSASDESNVFHESSTSSASNASNEANESGASNTSVATTPIINTVETASPVLSTAQPERETPVLASSLLADEPLSQSVLRVPVQIYTEEDREIIPVREVVESLGGQVFWIGEVRQISIILAETRIIIDTPRQVVVRNGQEIVPKVHLYWIDGHYYLPFDEVLLMLGDVVDATIL